MNIDKHLFEATKNAVEDHVDSELSIELIRNPVTNSEGDTNTVGTYENMPTSYENGRRNLTQTKIHIINESGEYYVEAIYKQFQDDPSVTLLEWIEVVDPPLRGNGIGRTLLENTIDHIEQTTETTHIYTKVENPHMVGPNIDCGFQEVDIVTNETWHKLTL